jgi:hypothetical protein
LELLQSNAFLSPKREQISTKDSKIKDLYTAQNMLRLLIATTPIHVKLHQTEIKGASNGIVSNNRIQISCLNLTFDIERIILGLCFNSNEGLPYLHVENGVIVSKTLLNFNPDTISNLAITAFKEFQKQHIVNLEPLPSTPEIVHFFWIYRRLMQVEDIIGCINTKRSHQEKDQISRNYGFNIVPIGMLLDAAWGVQDKHINAFNLVLNGLNSPGLQPIFHYLNFMEAKARFINRKMLNP